MKKKIQDKYFTKVHDFLFELENQVLAARLMTIFTFLLIPWKHQKQGFKEWDECITASWLKAWKEKTNHESESN